MKGNRRSEVTELGLRVNVKMVGMNQEKDQPFLAVGFQSWVGLYLEGL